MCRSATTIRCCSFSTWRRDVAGMRDGAALLWSSSTVIGCRSRDWLPPIGVASPDLRLLCMATWACWALSALACSSIGATGPACWLLPATLLLMQPRENRACSAPPGFYPAALLLFGHALRCDCFPPASRWRSFGHRRHLCAANGLLLFPIIALAAFSRRWWSGAWRGPWPARCWGRVFHGCSCWPADRQAGFCRHFLRIS